MTLYAATSNPNKLAEFAGAAAEISPDLQLEVQPLPGLADMPEPVEDAPTFLGNAEQKAIAYSLLAPGLLVLADDSGLEVDALGGRPGVRSARFAADLNFSPDPASSTEAAVTPPSSLRTKDERNNACLLHLLAELPNARRSARFVCALVLARDGEVVLRAEGTVEGEILSAPRGQDGFGYDPLFLLPTLGRTLAELAREHKWRISHRGNAFRHLLAQLPSLLPSQASSS